MAERDDPPPDPVEPPADAPLDAPVKPEDPIAPPGGPNEPVDGKEGGADDRPADGGNDNAGDGGASSIRVEVHSAHLNADHVKAAGILVEEINLLAGPGIASPVQLSVQHFRALSSDELDPCEAALVFAPESVETLRWRLEEKRILILSGEPESGKGSTALLVGASLLRTLRLAGLLTSQGLDTAVEVDLEKIASDSAYRSRVVIFEDALTGGNPSVRAFLKTVDAGRLATLAGRLRRNGSALVLTVTSHTVADFEKRLAHLGILAPLAPSPPDLLRQAFRRFAESLSPDQTATLADSLKAIEDDLVHERATIPRIARFVQEYLGEFAKGNFTVRQILTRMADPSGWLTTDLAGDPEAQAAALAITVGTAVPPTLGVPWLLFDVLRRRIADVLRAELHLPADEPPPSTMPGRAGALERARAQMVALPSPLPSLARFRDDRTSWRIWQALLGPARELATVLLPLLRELSLEPDPYLRALAASALGRLGQLGPAHLAVPLLEEWTQNEAVPDDALGFFLLGAVASDDRDYRELCLATLRRLAIQDRLAVAQAAISGLRILGRTDPALPIHELCHIARSRLPVQKKRLYLVADEVAVVEDSIRNGVDPRRITRQLQQLRAESQILLAAALVPGERIRLLGALQYSLAGVLFSQGGDPGAALRELTNAMKTEPEKVAPLLVYLCLHRGGLIAVLDRYKWTAAAFGTEPCSRFLLAAARGPEGAEALRCFLETLVRAFMRFPGAFRSVLEHRLLQILRNWSEEGCQVLALRPTLVALLTGLADSPNPDLRQIIDRLLRTDPAFTAKGGRLRALAVDVLDGGRTTPPPAASETRRRLPAWMVKREEEG
jgi:hypothetical protein